LPVQAPQRGGGGVVGESRVAYLHEPLGADPRGVVRENTVIYVDSVRVVGVRHAKRRRGGAVVRADADIVVGEHAVLECRDGRVRLVPGGVARLLAEFYRVNGEGSAVCVDQTTRRVLPPLEGHVLNDDCPTTAVRDNPVKIIAVDDRGADSGPRNHQILCDGRKVARQRYRSLNAENN